MEVAVEMGSGSLDNGAKAVSEIPIKAGKLTLENDQNTQNTEEVGEEIGEEVKEEEEELPPTDEEPEEEEEEEEEEKQVDF